MQWQIETIINVANSLQQTGRSGGSTGEVIAAAFVLNRPDYLPAAYQDMVEAWDRLEPCWQADQARLHALNRGAVAPLFWQLKSDG